MGIILQIYLKKDKLKILEMFVEKDVAMDKNVVQGAWIIWGCTLPRLGQPVCLSLPSPSPAAAAAARQQMQGRFPP